MQFDCEVKKFAKIFFSEKQKLSDLSQNNFILNKTESRGTND